MRAWFSETELHYEISGTHRVTFNIVKGIITTTLYHYWLHLFPRNESEGLRVTKLILNVDIDAIRVLEYIALSIAHETVHGFYFDNITELGLESWVFWLGTQIFFINSQVAEIIVLLFLEHLIAVDNAVHNSYISFLRMILCKEAYLGLVFWHLAMCNKADKLQVFKLYNPVWPCSCISQVAQDKLSFVWQSIEIAENRVLDDIFWGSSSNNLIFVDSIRCFQTINMEPINIQIVPIDEAAIDTIGSRAHTDLHWAEELAYFPAHNFCGL